MIMNKKEMLYASTRIAIYNFLNNDVGTKEDIINIIDIVINEIGD